MTNLSPTALAVIKIKPGMKLTEVQLSSRVPDHFLLF